MDQWCFPRSATEFDVTTKGPGCRCRNLFTDLGTTSLDLSFGKELQIPAMRVIGEGAGLEIRANFFNASTS